MIGYGLGIPRALGSGRFMQKIENAEWKLGGYHIFYVAATWPHGPRCLGRGLTVERSCKHFFCVAVNCPSSSH